jgi:polysaccharide export outer membrane protein
MILLNADRSCLFATALRTAALAVVTATLVAGAVGCVLSPRSPGMAKSATSTAPQQAPKLANGVPTEYAIGIGDVLEILVWRNEALSRTVIVRPDGKISLPLLNDIQAAGLTPMQLKEQIAIELKKFKELPEVSVIVTETRSQVVYLMGQVAKPGPYPVGPNATVLQVIAQAGGFSPFADRDNILVIRRDAANAKEQRIRVSYKSILAGRTSTGDIALRAGDTIIVP